MLKGPGWVRVTFLPGSSWKKSDSGIVVNRNGLTQGAGVQLHLEPLLGSDKWVSLYWIIRLKVSPKGPSYPAYYYLLAGLPGVARTFTTAQLPRPSPRFPPPPPAPLLTPDNPRHFCAWIWLNTGSIKEVFHPFRGFPSSSGTWWNIWEKNR